MVKKVKRDITEVVDSYLCHSCGSCFSSCGHDCISYNQSPAGFLFPKIDYDSCTNCGLCFDVCPGEHFNKKLIDKTSEDPFIGNIEKVLVGKAEDKEIYLNSQSGGVTTALLKYLLDEKLVSAAVVTQMNELTLKSEPKIIKNSSELLSSQKSKYVPTNLTSIIPDILKIEGKVAIVGLSCHMHGLENLTGIRKKLNDKLIKIGLICDRVMLYSAIPFFTEKITKNSVTNFVFRDTSNTSYPGDISFQEDGKLHIMDKKNRKNMKDFFTPTRCMLCFDKMNIYSDIVLGDPHGIDNTDKENGESLVLIRTSLGEEIVNGAINKKFINLREASLEQAISGQGIELKRKKFNANINAWKELGNTIPSYPENVFSFSIEASKEEVEKAKERLLHSINLDKLADEKEVVAKANQFYNKKNRKKGLFSKIKKIFRGDK